MVTFKKLLISLILGSSLIGLGCTSHPTTVALCPLERPELLPYTEADLKLDIDLTTKIISNQSALKTYVYNTEYLISEYNKSYGVSCEKE